MKIIDIINPAPISISPVSTLLAAALRMKLLDVGMLTICKDNKLVGVLTDRDIIIRSIAQGLDPKYTAAQDAMTLEVVFCFEDQDLEEAARLMEDKKIRRLPVLNREGQVVGLVTMGDVATHSENMEMAGKMLESISTPALPDLPPISPAHAGLVQAMA
jgi:CBS domain-containing protein